MNYSEVVGIAEEFLNTLDAFGITSGDSNNINYLCEVELADMLIKDIRLEE